MGLDLAAYAARTGYPGEFRPLVEALRALHLAHATHIPFENLDVLWRRPPRLDVDSLCQKLVTGGRGGYCFEHNSLFASVLEACGFRVRRLAARVRMGTTGVRPRSHMLLMVEAGGEQWLADVGFGADGLLYPVPFRLEEASVQFAWKNRIVQEGDCRVLQSWRPEGWVDLYAFGLEEQYPIDFEVANHYTATYPGGVFTKMLLVQRPGPEMRVMVVNRKLIERTADGVREKALGDDEELRDVLARRFGLLFPAGTRFPIEEG